MTETQLITNLLENDLRKYLLNYYFILLCIQLTLLSSIPSKNVCHFSVESLFFDSINNSNLPVKGDHSCLFFENLPWCLQRFTEKCIYINVFKANTLKKSGFLSWLALITVEWVLFLLLSYQLKRSYLHWKFFYSTWL